VKRLTLLLLLSAPLLVHAGGKETATIWSAVQVLEDVLSKSSEETLPLQLLQRSDGVVILPGMISVGWGVGLSHGSGIMLFHKEGEWNDPVFVTMSGASIGYQIGAQSSDVILTFKRPSSINELLNGKITLGVDAAIAAGPIGRDTTVATDPMLDSEIYSWSRSRGLFAGVALDGSVLSVDQTANALFYNQPGITGEEILQRPAGSRSSGLRRLKTLLSKNGEAARP
jgi:lipid-binding SYLF domain-containing protein